MKLILDLFRRIFEALQGVNYGYTAFESRAAALAAFGVEDIPEAELFNTEA